MAGTWACATCTSIGMIRHDYRDLQLWTCCVFRSRVCKRPTRDDEAGAFGQAVGFTGTDAWMLAQLLPAATLLLPDTNMTKLVAASDGAAHCTDMTAAPGTDRLRNGCMAKCEF